MKLKSKSNLSFGIIAVNLSALLFFAGCSDKKIVPPCPPCVEPSNSAGDPEDTPTPRCQKIKPVSYIYCDNPVATPDLSTISGRTPPQDMIVADPICRDELNTARSDCVGKRFPGPSGMYQRGLEICSETEDQYLAEGSNRTENLKVQFQREHENASCTGNCRTNWDWFYLQMQQNSNLNRWGVTDRSGSPGIGDELLNWASITFLGRALLPDDVPNIVPDDSVTVLYFEFEKFQKVIKPRHYWCAPGGIKGYCDNGNATDNLDPHPHDLSQGSCSHGLAVIATAAVVGGRGATNNVAQILGQLQSVVNLSEPAMAALRQALASGPRSQNSGATASSENRGKALTSKADAKGSSASTGSSGGGSTGGKLPTSAAGGAEGGTAAAGAGLGGLMASDSGSAATEGDGTTVTMASPGAGLEYASSGGGGGHGGSRSGGSGLGGMGSGGAASSDVSFSGGANGAGGPLSGLVAAPTDADFEALLQRIGDRSLFEIANRRYFQWSSDLLSREAKEQLKKLSK